MVVNGTLRLAGGTVTKARRGARSAGTECVAAARRSYPVARMERSGMRGGRAAWHESRIALRSIRATSIPATCFPIHNVKQRNLLRSRARCCARVFLLLPSQLPIPDRGDGGAPGGGILYPVARVIARRHVCEAWAVPRNRDGASRRSTVTVLRPLRARLRSCLRLGSRSEPPGHGLRAAAGTPPPAPPSGNASRKRPSMSEILDVWHKRVT
jgi:hypothetical protein